jgi:spoIIIJ-associated protein
VKDRVFAGPDVEGALAAAAETLGLPASSLRYVVLDPGTVGGRGLQPTPARVAVLLGDPPQERAAAVVEAPPTDPRAEVRSLVRAIATAAAIDVDVEVEEGEASVLVHVEGADEDFFLGPTGGCEVLDAVEHLLQRSVGVSFGARPVRLRSPRLQERRDAALVEDARRLAAEVRADGTARTTGPLNSYQRRVVHVALGGEPDLTTYSVGDGATRRVTVALASSTPLAEPD